MSALNPVLLSYARYPLLPTELIHVLNQAYFLHLLATGPEKVIPPGKGLLSMMAHVQIGLPEGKKEEEVLLNQVKEVAHKAFWDEAVESLSSPLPSVQITRLARLYGDLLEEVAPLFPPHHQIIKTLEAPLPPTSSPLHSTITFLKEMVNALQQRCAPVRDEEVIRIYRKLDEHIDPPLNGVFPHLKDGLIEDPADSKEHLPLSSPAAQLVVNVIKDIISVADLMKSDLNNAVLGSMSEAQLRGVVVQQAKLRERELVLQLWDDKQGTTLREKWRSWVAQPSDASVSQDKMWIVHLVTALGSDEPVSCDFPISGHFHNPNHKEDQPKGHVQIPPRPNDLPPQFFLTAPKLLYIQNYLQAIVITACLRSLTRLPPARTHDLNPEQPGHDFMKRTWTLLKAEIDVDEASPGINVGETKIINLADEVIRARRLSSTSGTITPEEETQLRASVERTLRPQDPVFLLLRRRLIDEVGKQLLLQFFRIESSPPSRSGAIPDLLKTGRGHEHLTIGKRARLIFPENVTSSPARSSEHFAELPVIKGFEDPILLKALEDVFRQLTGCFSWVESVWGDLV